MTPPNIWNLSPNQSPSLRPMNIPAILNANATTPIMLADIQRGSLKSAKVIPTANGTLLATRQSMSKPSELYNVNINDGSAKEIIELSSSKNKGKFSAKYYVNNQFKKELESYYNYMTAKYGKKLDADTYLFTSQKMNKPFNRVSICRIFSNIYKKFGIHGASHLGRHMFITKMINNGINPFLVKQLANHKSVQTTQRYYNSNPVQLLNAVETAKI